MNVSLKQSSDKLAFLLRNFISMYTTSTTYGAKLFTLSSLR